MLQNILPSKTTVLKVLLTLLTLFAFLMVYLNIYIEEQLAEKRYSAPAIVYARSLEMLNGKVLSWADFEKSLRSAGYSESPNNSYHSYYRNGTKVSIINPPFAYWDGKRGSETIRLQFNSSFNRVLSVKTQNQKGYARLLPAEIGRLHPEKNEDRLQVALSDVPQDLINALLMTEDRDFYNHIGLSAKGIARAMVTNIQQGAIVQGGSTITQQLAKNFFLSNERSFWRKIIEAPMALLIELHASKADILEAYLNEVFIAQDGARAIHGVGLASQYLFAKPLKDLSTAQSALLVAMLKGPSYYNPVRNPERAKKRRNLVIDLLHQNGKLSEYEALIAKQQDLGLSVRTSLSQSAPAYLDLVRRQLRRDYSFKDLTTQGLRIFTYLDPLWQNKAQLALQDGIRALEKKYPNHKFSALDGSVVVTDNHSGDVIALVGGKRPRASGFNRALDAHRQIGSLAKPAVALTAFERGHGLNTLISDEPFSLQQRAQKAPWRPRNFDKKNHGDVSINDTLAYSYNVATARLANKIGIEPLRDTFKALGVTSYIPNTPSLSLGAIELSPLQVAQMYNTIAADGFYTPLKAIRDITDRQGRPLNRYPLRLEQRFDTGHIHLTKYAMQSVMQYGTGKKVKPYFNKNRLIAGKTGTSSDQRDSWFIGFNKSTATVVWLGFDDNSSMPLTGSSGALPIWAEIMRNDSSRIGKPRIPKTVAYQWIDSKTGFLSKKGCENALYMPIMKGYEPTQKARCKRKKQSIKDWFRQWFQ